MQKIRLGVLGVGGRMRGLLKVYMQHPGVEVVAICDLYQRNINITVEQFPELKNVRHYLDYETMMKDCPMDALMITVNPYYQNDYACDAMERGVHVMTEVPCAFKLEDCEKLVKTVEKTGCVYQLAEQTRYMYWLAKWREMYRQGVFGHILVMEGEYLHYEKWDNYLDVDTGELFYSLDPLEAPGYGRLPVSSKPASERNIETTWRYQCMQHPILYMPHELSPLLSITDDYVTHVSCMGTKKGSYTDEKTLPVGRDMEVAVMKTAKGSILRLTAGFTSHHGHRPGTGNHWYHIEGVDASAEWARSEVDKPKLWTKDGGWQEMPDWTMSDPNAPEDAKVSGHGGMDWYPIDEFVHAIQEHRMPWMNVYRAVGSAVPAILAAQSADQEGKLLEVPEMFRRVK